MSILLLSILVLSTCLLLLLLLLGSTFLLLLVSCRLLLLLLVCSASSVAVHGLADLHGCVLEVLNRISKFLDVIGSELLGSEFSSGLDFLLDFIDFVLLEFGFMLVKRLLGVEDD